MNKRKICSVLKTKVSLFPMEAQIAMSVSQVEGKCKFAVKDPNIAKILN